MSPFCVKLETYLRMAKIPYKTARANFVKAPRGRIPYVTIDGQQLGDTTLIIDELKRRFGDPLDGALTAEQKARGLAVQRLMEDHLYFAGAWLRWTTDESWAHVKEVFRPMFPSMVGPLVIPRIRKGFVKYLEQQGILEHSREQIVEFAKEDVFAVSTLLGKNAFFFGDEPTSIDAMLYGFLIQQMWVPWESPVKAYAKTLPNLEAYCQRMKARYWA